MLVTHCNSGLRQPSWCSLSCENGKLLSHRWEGCDCSFPIPLLPRIPDNLSLWISLHQPMEPPRVCKMHPSSQRLTFGSVYGMPERIRRLDSCHNRGRTRRCLEALLEDLLGRHHRYDGNNSSRGITLKIPDPPVTARPSPAYRKDTMI